MMLIQPMPTPSARAASHRFCTARQVLYTSVSGMLKRPSTCSPARAPSQVIRRLSGASRMPCSLSDWYVRCRSSVETRASARVDRGEVLVDCLAHAALAQEHEVPGLHETRPRGPDGRPRGCAEHRVGHRIRTVVAYVTALEDGAINGISLAVREPANPHPWPSGCQRKPARVQADLGRVVHVRIRGHSRDKSPHRSTVQRCPMVGTTWRPLCARGYLRVWLVRRCSDRSRRAAMTAGPPPACGEEV